MANHEAVAALPVSGNADKDLIRAMATRRFAYCLEPDESAADLVATDPASGIKPRYLVQNGTLYQRDDADTTTSAGATCLVTGDGIRYKSDAVGIPFSVLDKDLTAQPDDPAEGDRYLIPTAATGADWAGKDGKIGEYTPRGWLFSTVPIGRWVYVEDEDALYYRNASGVWTSGPGSLVYSASTIPITAIIGAKASFIVKVENQTTNTPPSSPVAPVAYVIGPSPTGAWSGHAGDLAICLVDGSFTIIEPEAGDRVYDKSLGIQVEWNGTAWTGGNSTIIQYKTTGLQTSQLSSGAGSSLYAYQATVAPTTSSIRNVESSTLSVKAARAGTKLLFRYQAAVDVKSSLGSTTGTSTAATVMIFKNSDSAAIAWFPVEPPAASSALTIKSFNVEFEIAAADDSTHTYTAAITSTLADNSGIYRYVLSRRRFSVTEIG